MEEKLNYINVGCGGKYHNDWVNVDMNSFKPGVISVNLLNGIPYPDNQFDVVYHSQVLEHFSKEQAPDFMKECFRILKPGGILRVVVPDLEDIAKEYLRFLNESMEHPNELAAANYDWVLLEMLDQCVRNETGGEMAKFFQRKDIINEKYVVDRIGNTAKSIRKGYLEGNPPIKSKIQKKIKELGFFKLVKLVFGDAKKKIAYKLLGQKYRIGDFRMGGEIHYWMYDRYSLSRMLTEIGFHDIKVQNPFKSEIKDWAKYELDVKDGAAIDPTSLFIEAKK